jgi:uncharacterized protein
MITQHEQLMALWGSPSERAVRKQLQVLDGHAQRFIASSPLCVLASVGTAGADASPRGGAPGFVKVADEQTLLIPEVVGNRRLDSLHNLLDDPRIGLLFLVPGTDETLRVNGRACVRDEADLLARFDAERQRPRVVVEVRVQEVYLHCAKAFMRSQLWEPAQWSPRSALPTMGEMLHFQLGLPGEPESQTEMRARYQAQLDAETRPSNAQ